MQNLTGWKRLEVFIWYHAPSPKIGGRTPKQLIEDGKLKRLLTHIEENYKKKSPG